MNLASTLGREPPFSILACIFPLMSSTELGPFRVLAVFSCFLKDSWAFDLGVDGFESFPFWFDFCAFLVVICLFYFCWSIVDLQCGVSFWCTARWSRFFLIIGYYKILNIALDTMVNFYTILCLFWCLGGCFAACAYKCVFVCGRGGYYF